MRPISRGAVFWGAAFITGGVVVLAIQQGWISEDILAEAARWWPLFLIGAGVAIMFQGALGVIATGLAGVLLGLLVGGLIGGAPTFSVGCGTGEPRPLEAYADGTFSDPGAQVRLDLSCATLEVAGDATDANWAVQADTESAPDITVDPGSTSLAVRTEEGPTFGLDRPRHVGVSLPGDISAAFELRFNAGSATVDLSDGLWGALDLNGNAMSMTVDLSDAGADSLDVSVNAGSAAVQFGDKTGIGSVTLGVNAGSIEVCAPDVLGLQFTIGNEVASSHNLDDQGLSQSGNVWRTANYASADQQIDIVFSGNAASLTLNPEGGCS